MIGEEDILLVASTSSLDASIANIEEGWHRPGVAEDLAEVGAREPFALWSLFIAGPAELARYTQNATVFTDDKSALEFSAPRELHTTGASENAAALTALLGPQSGPPIIRRVRAGATAAEWRNRGAMMFKSDMFGPAYQDYERALGAGGTGEDDVAALDGFVQAAIMAGRGTDALELVKASAANHPTTAAAFIAQSKLLESLGVADGAVAAAQQASKDGNRGNIAGVEQLASVYANQGKLAELDTTVETLRRVAPERAATGYFGAVAAFLHGQFADAVKLADRAVAADPAYAAVYDLAGAADTKLGDLKGARAAFETSLHFNAHDSSAYANLGLLELSAGNRAEAARDFSEALWLDPQSAPAREGLAQARQQVAR